MLRSLRVAACAVVLAAPACSAGGGGEDGRLQAVATVSPITNIVQNVGGDRIHVTGIVPEGTNSHTFVPAPSDARALAEADVVFMNGLHLEEPTLELATANVGPGVPIVMLGDRAVPPEEHVYDFSFPRSEGDPNPHVWTNPLYALEFAGVVRDVLVELDPAGRSAYHANWEAFSDRIGELDRAIREATGTVPEQDRKLLTYHDSFPYFAREYGWEVIGAIQPSDFSTPTAREVADLIEQIRAEGVPAIFGSEVFPSPVLEQIAAETGTRYVAELRDDDLPRSPGDPGHSYLGLMVFDIRTIVEALGGDPSALDPVDVSNVAGECCATYRE